MGVRVTINELTYILTYIFIVYSAMWGCWGKRGQLRELEGKRD